MRFKTFFAQSEPRAAPQVHLHGNPELQVAKQVTSLLQCCDGQSQAEGWITSMKKAEDVGGGAASGSYHYQAIYFPWWLLSDPEA